MATFMYDIRYEGKRMAENLGQEVARAIDGVKSELRVKPHPHHYFEISFKTIDPGNRVYLGIEKNDGKLAGTDELRMHFSGFEKDVLEFKAQLLGKLPKLELI
ncbi:MAG TPA: hypothetical protein VJK03_01960 [Candidatus Nanoarchaeia archaeon]|nr:hypothetical protein [Candidatus Nanoarchaeia archaeon]